MLKFTSAFEMAYLRFLAVWVIANKTNFMKIMLRSGWSETPYKFKFREGI